MNARGTRRAVDPRPADLRHAPRRACNGAGVLVLIATAFAILAWALPSLALEPKIQGGGDSMHKAAYSRILDSLAVQANPDTLEAENGTLAASGTKTVKLPGMGVSWWTMQNQDMSAILFLNGNAVDTVSVWANVPFIFPMNGDSLRLEAGAAGGTYSIGALGVKNAGH